MVENRQLIIGISLIVALILIVVLIWPKYQELSIFEKQIEGKKTELELETTYFAHLQQVSQELKQYENQLSKIDSALPQTSFLPDLLNFIQKAASQSGLLLKEISPVKTTQISSEETAQIKEVKLSLSLVGDYFSFKNFLSALETSARLIEVENISFSSPKEGPFTFDLIIKVYSY